MDVCGPDRLHQLQMTGTRIGAAPAFDAILYMKPAAPLIFAVAGIAVQVVRHQPHGTDAQTFAATNAGLGRRFLFFGKCEKSRRIRQNRGGKTVLRRSAHRTSRNDTGGHIHKPAAMLKHIRIAGSDTNQKIFRIDNRRSGP